MMLFKDHAVKIFEADLENRAVQIADSLSALLSGDSVETSGNMGGGNMHNSTMWSGRYGSYLRFIDEIAMADVWIVDEGLNSSWEGRGTNSNIITVICPRMPKMWSIMFLRGETVISQGFSGLLETPTLTVGTPIVQEGQVVGLCFSIPQWKGWSRQSGMGCGF